MFVDGANMTRHVNVYDQQHGKENICCEQKDSQKRYFVSEFDVRCFLVNAVVTLVKPIAKERKLIITRSLNLKLIFSAIFLLTRVLLIVICVIENNIFLLINWKRYEIYSIHILSCFYVTNSGICKKSFHDWLS